MVNNEFIIIIENNYLPCCNNMNKVHYENKKI